VSASYLRSSDTSGISRRTAFTCPIPSGVNSAPDSRETVMANGCAPAENGPAVSNIASSTRMNGSNGSNGNGSSTADGAGFASNDGNQGSANGANGVSSAAPLCNGVDGVLHEDGALLAKCEAAVQHSAGR
jgi:hypothetical protein